MTIHCRRSAGRYVPAIALLLSAWFVPAVAAPGAPALFLNAGPSPARVVREASIGLGVIRGRPVTIDRAALNALRPGSGRLDLPLFDDTRLTGLVDRVAPNALGAVSYSGRIAEDPNGYFALVMRGDAVAGTIRTAGGDLYELGMTESGDAYVRQIDPEALPPCGITDDMLVSPENPSAAPRGLLPLDGGEAIAASEEHVTIDLMIVYTSQAMSSSGGKAAIEARAQLAVDQANLAYANSGIHATLRLVLVAPVTYTETSGAAGFHAALDALTYAGDGRMDEVHALRNQYGADVVSLLVANTSYCGLAWVMVTPSNDFASHGFSVVSYNCTSGTTLAHEIGHNQGSHHDRENAYNTSGQLATGAYPYSYGWRFSGSNGTTYRTVMSYSPGLAIPHFSNPDVLYNNRATGVPVGQANQSHNALSINNTRFIVSDWRMSSTELRLEMTGYPIIAEDCLPGNGAADPGERVTLSVGFRNPSQVPTSNVVATVEAGPDVEVITPSQVYGALPPASAVVSRPFDLRAYGDCGDTVTLRLRLKDGSVDLGVYDIPLRLGAYVGVSPTRTVYSSPNAGVSIPAGGSVDYPIYVTDEGAVGNLRVQVRLNHNSVGSLHLSLRAPDGTTTVLSDHNGGTGDNFGSGGNNCYGFFTVFDDNATALITSTSSAPPYTGSYRPEEPLSRMVDKGMRGYWTLTVSSLPGSSAGTIGCWKLDVARQEYSCCARPMTLLDAMDALLLAGGLSDAQSWHSLLLNLRDTPPSTARVDILDAVAIIRKATGLDH